mgnify:CR=1 FL=1
MATLNEVMKDTADAIREKKGTSDLIAPIDFAEEIKGITAGGESSESGVECFYYSQRGAVIQFQSSWKDYSLLVKIKIDNMIAIVPSMLFKNALDANEEPFTEAEVVAVCIANPMIYSPDTGLIPLVETIEMFDKYPFITKEQFYDLNA